MALHDLFNKGDYFAHDINQLLPFVFYKLSKKARNSITPYVLFYLYLYAQTINRYNEKVSESPIFPQMAVQKIADKCGEHRNTID